MEHKIKYTKKEKEIIRTIDKIILMLNKQNEVWRAIIKNSNKK